MALLPQENPRQTGALQDAILAGPVAALSLERLGKIASTPAQRTELLVDFISSGKSDLSDLRAAQRIFDLPACARLAHRMVGASRMIGAIELAEACECMERAARLGSSADMAKADSAMDEALIRIEANLVEAKRMIAG